MAKSSGSQDEGTGSRRGRKPIRPDPESGPVALLAHRLWELKERAGDPSFAEMASRLGAAASKSSLAAAARGNALPSWETTWEFVRVLAVDRLGQDPAEARREWRGYWQQAGDTGSNPESRERAENTENEPSMQDEIVPRPKSPVRKLVLIALLPVAALIAWVVIGNIANKEFPVSQNTKTENTATQNTTTQPASPHDDSVFERDVTFPDGSVVKKGIAFTKIWRIRNTGTVTWRGRYLTRINDAPCQAPKRVGIRAVLPGESVDIAVPVRAADAPGRCKIYWKMTSEDGTPLFAEKKPIFLDVTVS
jgi:hypothetical protein